MSRAEAAPTVGVLALQGGVAEHAELLEKLGASVRLVRRPGDLEGLDGLVLPGGESTTIDRLTRIFGLREPLIAAVREGLPVLGTCAGLILLSTEVEDTAAGQQVLGLLDVTMRRNAFGPQVDSAEAELPWTPAGGGAASVTAAFIRAPEVIRLGDGVEACSVLVDAEGRRRVVGVRSGAVTGVSFHPELTGDETVHAEFLGRARAHAGARV